VHNADEPHSSQCTVELEHGHSRFVDPWGYSELSQYWDQSKRFTGSDAASIKCAYTVIARIQYRTSRFWIRKLGRPAV
jgi:hypothetical protein